jgi:hypothetical protein
MQSVRLLVVGQAYDNLSLIHRPLINQSQCTTNALNSSELFTFKRKYARCR